jgi:hypothetical protein
LLFVSKRMLETQEATWRNSTPEKPGDPGNCSLGRLACRRHWRYDRVRASRGKFAYPLGVAKSHGSKAYEEVSLTGEIMMALCRTLRTACTVLLLFWLAVVGPFAWILRDGLGPNAVDSTGWYALARFLMTFFWGPIALVLLALTVALTWTVRTCGRN